MSRELVHARVVESLSRLRMRSIAERLDALLSEAARTEPTYLDFLDKLLCEEIGSKQRKRVAMGIQIAHFPAIKTLEDFATCADWELAGGYTTVDGKRVKDTGLLEKYDMSLEEAQTLVMNARVQLGWVDPADLVAQETEAEAVEDRA